MSEMTTTEILERFNEGLRRTASRAREMYSLVNNPMWLDIAKSIDGIRENGGKMAIGKALTRTQVLQLLDDKRAKTGGQKILN